MADTIRVGHIGLSFHEASALEVAHVLQAHGASPLLDRNASINCFGAWV